MSRVGQTSRLFLVRFAAVPGRCAAAFRAGSHRGDHDGI